MPYRALYRQWRPQVFGEIVGQEHVTRTLKNALLTGRVAHAYLFCGPRGTGKTSTAKVLAKALNCRQRQGAEPCNRCAVCRSVNDGSSMDVVEIDAASHRGIDEIRELREKVSLAPAAGAYRVYIIDEVHMLTNEAFNALLKTLEEPPAHIVFILATTEPRKVPLTILSRCQRFDFHRIDLPVMLARLQEVVAGAQLQATEEALGLIARAADGGLRDALAILDQTVAFAGQMVTAKDVHQVLGTVQEDVLAALAGDLSAGRADGALHLLADMVEQGRDLHLLLRDLTAFLRRLLLSKVAAGRAPAGEEKRPLAQAGSFTSEQLLHILHIFTQAEQDMKWSSQPRVILEMALVEAAYPEVGDGTAALSRRVAQLEETVLRLTHSQGKTAAKAPEKHHPPAGDGPADLGKALFSAENGGSCRKNKTGAAAALSRETDTAAKRLAAEYKEERPAAGGPGQEASVQKARRREMGEAAEKNAAGYAQGSPAAGPAVKRSGRGSAPGQTGVPVEKSEYAAPIPDKPAGFPTAAGKQLPAGGEEPAARPKASGISPGNRTDEATLRRVCGRWQEVTALVKDISLPVHTYMKNCRPWQVQGDCLVLAFPPDDLFKGRMEEDRNRKVLEEAMSALFKHSWRVRCIYNDDQPQPAVAEPAEEKLDSNSALSLFGVTGNDEPGNGSEVPK